MKLPELLEELNQGAEKAFGDNAQKVIDRKGKIATEIEKISQHGQFAKRLKR